MTNNLLIGNTQEEANRYKDYFNLGEDWYCCGAFSSMSGRRFKKVIILKDTEPKSLEDKCKFKEWFYASVRTKIPLEGGEIIIL